MNSNCCQGLIHYLQNVTSPFSRYIAFDYYDGPKEGLVECGNCRRVWLFRFLDWDFNQDLRIFSLADSNRFDFDKCLHLLQPISGTRTKGIVTDISHESEATSFVDRLFSTALPPSLVLATYNLLEELVAVRPIDSETVHDWFKKLGLVKSADEDNGPRRS